MKRLLILMLLLCLTACSAAPEEKREPEPPADPPAEAAPPAENKQPLPKTEAEVLRWEVELLLMEDVWEAEDGTPLLTCSVQVPQMAVLREDGTAVTEDETDLTALEEWALSVADAFNQRFYDWTVKEHYDKLAETAREDLNWFREEGLDWYGSYACDMTCSVYQTEQLVSISGLYYTYTGGAHPNTSWLSWNFDLTEGTFIGPELLADGAELQSAVAAEILRQARTPGEGGCAPADEYWEDHEALIADWPNYAVSFDGEGMTVVFSPYELAPYAAGPQEFSLSYDWLRPHLGPHGLELLGLGAAE